jgi:hypothetical protein
MSLKRHKARHRGNLGLDTSAVALYNFEEYATTVKERTDAGCRWTRLKRRKVC